VPETAGYGEAQKPAAVYAAYSPMLGGTSPADAGPETAAHKAWGKQPDAHNVITSRHRLADPTQGHECNGNK
jgi:hypothetical protein